MRTAMNAPLVSVIIATRDNAASIGEALATLGRQQLRDIEVIVADAGSRDDTRAIVAACGDPRVRLLANVAGGSVAARGAAIAAARGRYVAALDPRDLCDAARLARQVAYLESNPRVALVGAAVSIDTGRATRSSHMPAATTPALLGWLTRLFDPLHWTSIMLRTDVAHELAGSVRPELGAAANLDFYLRVSAYGPIARIDDPLVTLRGRAPAAIDDRSASDFSEVLARVYRPVLGDAVDEAATLVARHVACGLPVPDQATLEQLGAIIGMLQASYIDTITPGRESLRLIRDETTRLWWRIGRRAVRSGTVPLAAAAAAPPQRFGLARTGSVSGLIDRLLGKDRLAARRLAS